MEFKMTEDGFTTETAFGPLHISADETAGFLPVQLMVASVAICSGTVIRKILKKKRKKIEAFRIQTEVVRNPDAADRIESIHMTFQISAQGLSEEAMERILHLTRKHCSMVQSVHESIHITESFELV
ncbi:OsmC family protein [Pullulanibacillus camelliae]|nr:OsmC family protein [Pullulanibacillus camelliae]